MSTEGWPWMVWTERERESPRKGFTPEQLDRTLLHLADRGDRTCRMHPEWDGTGEPPAIVEVDLTTYEARTS